MAIHQARFAERKAAGEAARPLQEQGGELTPLLLVSNLLTALFCTAAENHVTHRRKLPQL
jgi:hypothetical protein